jgi:hypothetical protein
MRGYDEEADSFQSKDSFRFVGGGVNRAWRSFCYVADKRDSLSKEN